MATLDEMIAKIKVSKAFIIDGFTINFNQFTTYSISGHTITLTEYSSGKTIYINLDNAVILTVI